MSSKKVSSKPKRKPIVEEEEEETSQVLERTLSDAVTDQEESQPQDELYDQDNSQFDENQATQVSESEQQEEAGIEVLADEAPEAQLRTQRTPVNLNKKRVTPDAPKKVDRSQRNLQPQPDSPRLGAKFDEVHFDELVATYLKKRDSKTKQKLESNEAVTLSEEFLQTLKADQVEHLISVVHPDSFASRDLNNWARKSTINRSVKRHKVAESEVEAVSESVESGRSSTVGTVGQLNWEACQLMNLDEDSYKCDKAEGNNIYYRFALDHELFCYRIVNKWNKKVNGKIETICKNYDRVFPRDSVTQKLLGQRYLGVELKEIEIVSPPLILDMLALPPFGPWHETEAKYESGTWREKLRPKTKADLKVKFRFTNEAVNELDRDLDEFERRKLTSDGSPNPNFEPRYASKSYAKWMESLDKIGEAVRTGLLAGPQVCPDSDDQEAHQCYSEFYEQVKLDYETNRRQLKDKKFKEYLNDRIGYFSFTKADGAVANNGIMFVYGDQPIFQCVTEESHKYLKEKFEEFRTGVKPYSHKLLRDIGLEEGRTITKKEGEVERSVKILGYIEDPFPMERRSTPEERAKNPTKIRVPMTNGQKISLYQRNPKRILAEGRWSLGFKMSTDKKSFGCYMRLKSVTYLCDVPESKSKSFETFCEPDEEIAQQVAAVNLPDFMQNLDEAEEYNRDIF